jgi:hypothetical protein
MWVSRIQPYCPRNRCSHERRGVRSAHAASKRSLGDANDACRRGGRHALACDAAINARDASHNVVALSRRGSCRPYRHGAHRQSLGGYVLRGLWDHRLGAGRCDSGQHRSPTGGIGSDSGAQLRQRKCELLADRVWRSGLLGRLGGTTASRIPPSQSSFPLFIFTGLTDAKPAFFSQAVVSATE